MESRFFLNNFLKALLLTIVTLLAINLTGFIFDLCTIYSNNQIIHSFEYNDFEFFLNGEQTYNQFAKKYIILNILIFLGYFIHQCKHYKDPSKLTKGPEMNLNSDMKS